MISYVFVIDKMEIKYQDFQDDACWGFELNWAELLFAEMYVDLTPEFKLLVSNLASRASELGINVVNKDKSRILGEKVGQEHAHIARYNG